MVALGLLFDAIRSHDKRHNLDTQNACVFHQGYEISFGGSIMIMELIIYLLLAVVILGLTVAGYVAWERMKDDELANHY